MKPFPKDVNIEIMNRLDDKSLTKFCQTNKAAEKICNSEEFWKNRIYKIFGERTPEVLKHKSKQQSFQNFYKTEDFSYYRNKIYPLCEEIRKFPHESQLVVDDFYNPDTGFIPKVLTRDTEGIKFLLLKIVLLRMEKEVFRNFEEEEKLKRAIEKTSNEIDEINRNNFDFSTFDLTAKDRETFYKLIDVNVPRPELIKIGARMKSKAFKYGKDAPESYKLILHIHKGFRKGLIPLDIKWDELCTHPYLYERPEIKLK
jgi:F-box domain